MVAGLATGNVAVAYENFDAATGIRTIHLAFARPDGSVPATFVVGDTGNPAFPDIAGIPGAGRFVVVFQEVAKGIYCRQYSESSVPVEDQPQRISGTANCISSQVVGLNDGGFIVAWIDLNAREGDGTIGQEIFLQRFNSFGQPVGGRLEIDKPGDQILTDMAMLDDRPSVPDEAGSRRYARLSKTAEAATASQPPISRRPPAGAA